VAWGTSCRRAEQREAEADSVPVAAPAPPAVDTGEPSPTLEGPWASRAWRAWRDTATAVALVDTALADLAAPRADWPPATTWEFVSEALAARAAESDTSVAPALLNALVDSTRADSLASQESFQSAVSAVFEAHPAHFAVSYGALPPEARDHVVGALLAGWLRRALDGRAPLDPPSARLADLARTPAAHGLQARLAMREAPYLKALRDALEGRRGVVT